MTKFYIVQYEAEGVDFRAQITGVW